MPVVPRYQQGQVQQTNLPNARYSADGASPEAFGAGIARGLAATGEVFERIAQQERDKVDTAAVMEAEARLREQQNEMLFGEAGAFRTKGKDAFGLPERVLPDFEKRRGEIAAGLRGRQRQLFEQRTGMWQTDMQGDLLRHVARESDEYTRETTAAYIKSSADTALLFYNDPKRVAAEIERAQQAYIVGNPGEPAEATRLGLKEIESGIHASIVSRIANDDPVAAQAYYDQYRDKFTGGQQAEIERVLLPAVEANEADNLAEALLTRGVPDGGAATSPDLADYPTFRRDLESDGRADARNPDSSATGADQFVDDTWLRMVAKERPAWARGLSRQQILAARTDPEKSGEMAAALDRDNAAALRRAGQPVNRHTLYAAHHFGESRGVAFARASADTPMERILSPQQMAANDYLRGMTKAQAIANWDARAAKAAARRGGGAPGSAATPAAGAPLSFAQAKQWALDNIDDPKKRRAVLSSIEQREAVDNARQAEIERGMIQAINAKVEQADPSTPLARILTPQELAWANENGRTAAWEARLKARVVGGDVDTPRDQLLAYRAVVYKAARGDQTARAELAKYNPYDPKLQMSQQDRDWLANAQSNVLSDDPAKRAKAVTEGEFDSVVTSYTLNNLGVSKPAMAKSEKAITFDRDMRTWRDQFVRQTGREPTYTETIQQADLLVLREAKFSYPVPGMLWGTNTETATIAELGIPQTDLRLIVEALTAEGKPVNGDTVAAKWRARMQRANAQ